MLIAAIAGCKLFETDGSERDTRPEVQSPQNLFNIPAQMVSHDLVRSIRLHRAGNPSAAPIIELGRNQQLELTFDMLEFDSRRFRISFTHHNPDWSRSSLSPNVFLEGFLSLYLDAGEVSRSHRPHYRQYSYRFPNDQVRFTRSGNYMLRVDDQDTGHTLFTLPFFIVENEGSVRSSVEEQVTPRQNLRISHRPVSYYELPDLVEQPQFDLQFYYVQNQFWGRSRRATEVDFSDPNEAFFELDRNRPFIGDYEFLDLRITELSQRNPQVLEARPGEVPPKLILRDDAQGFSATGSQFRTGRFGRPSSQLTSGYANVQFSFDPGEYNGNGDIYVVGDFNNWSIHTNNKLQYNDQTGRWQTSSIIKQGSYYYKYVLFDGRRVDDLYFDDRFTRFPQEYHALVYMRDTNEFYYRLLQFNQFFSGS